MTLILEHDELQTQFKSVDKRQSQIEAQSTAAVNGDKPMATVEQIEKISNELCWQQRRMQTVIETLDHIQSRLSFIEKC